MTWAANLEATWPPLQGQVQGPFYLRSGGGGGKRVSAASLIAPFEAQDIAQAEAAMQRMAQPPLFVIWPDDPAQADLDTALNARGYQIMDPVLGYSAGIDHILKKNADLSETYPHWPPLALASQLWAAAGIGTERLSVMARATGPKTAILARCGDHPAGVCFVAVANQTAMIHALDVAAPHRRQGVAQKLIIRAARWAQEHGAVNLSLVVACANAPARALYSRLGMQAGPRFHYRGVASGPEMPC
jgi:GNAT superfamily N-acetyltransferase